MRGLVSVFVFASAQRLGSKLRRASDVGRKEMDGFVMNVDAVRLKSVRPEERNVG